MAKKELHRKIIATVLTALALGAALALCIVLLVSSPVFSGALRITMLVCTVALAVAIVGLVVCKVQEIRTLAEIVRLDKQAPHRRAAAPGDEAEAPAPRAGRAAPASSSSSPESQGASSAARFFGARARSADSSPASRSAARRICAGLAQASVAG